MEKTVKMKNYYVGLDIGTNSVGYAVTTPDYELMKYRGEAMWGSHVFEEANQCADRRIHRTARRRLDRRQQRIQLIQEIFAEEIGKKDERFFIRLKESALYREDTSGKDSDIFFQDKDFHDRDYNRKYPTIHHLIVELMEKKEPHDVRLVYLAVAWLTAHRGHFLNEVSKDNVSKILDLHTVYDKFLNYYEENELEKTWTCEEGILKEILLTKTNISGKEKLFVEKLFDGKKPKADDRTVISNEGIIKLLSGGTIELGKLFCQREFEDKVSVSFRMSEEDFENILSQIEDDMADFLIRLRNVYDWSLLADILNGENDISKAKVGIYEQHKSDLKKLKGFIKKYIPQKYNEIFREERENNYTAYSYNFNSCKAAPTIKGKASEEEFCSYLIKIVKGVECEEADRSFYDDMMKRLELRTFLPKQVNGDNRVIPYQLYYVELKKILENAKEYLPFLAGTDEDGITNIDKLLSVFTFRIPYYVGPLHKENSNTAWIQRRAGETGRIYPWNFAKMVDLDASENAFIRKMTNTCTYLPGEDVLPKNSLLYSKFTVLNEINNIKVNDMPISVEAKQGVYSLFENKRKVRVKDIKDYLISNNYMRDSDTLGGIDININASLKSYWDFKGMLSRRALSEKDVEKIIERLTYSEDKQRVRRWLEQEYPTLSIEDKKYICKLKYKDFGRMSRKFLAGFRGVVKETGELLTIIETLWETNDNLMEIIFSEQYGFKEELEKIRKEYYMGQTPDKNTLLDGMYISNAVKRPIYRTLAIMKDIVKASGGTPKKIFVEMARGSDKDKKRTKTRRNQIEELYQHFDRQEVRELPKQLESKTDNELQSDVLFLYFLQLGKCMYSGTPLDIDKLKTESYNVDHIYPQAYVKDDSLSNKVLVLSEINGNKGDSYPIHASIREKMYGIWKAYKEKGLISEEKFKRLTRNTKFSEEEKMGFINRQLVETRQSTKALTAILKNLYPETEIIYVKAGLATDFRQTFDIKKCRLVNDLPHAKDAYLNIVCGNVYHSKFTSRYFSLSDSYSLRTEAMYTHAVRLGNEVIWKGTEDLKHVKEIVGRNNIHYTRFSFMRKGELFDQMPLKASEGLVPRKANLDSARYGGYNKPAASCFLLTKYTEKKKQAKTEIMFLPVDLMVVHQVFSNENFALNYAAKTISGIWGMDARTITDICFPLGLRALKVNTVINIDGFLACISGKDSGGKLISCKSMVSLFLSAKEESYIKRIESYKIKKERNKNIVLDEIQDGINREDNLRIYDLFIQKLTMKPFHIAYASLGELLKNGREKYMNLDLESQSFTLLNCLEIFSTSRTGGCDLTAVGGSKGTGNYRYSSKLSNMGKNHESITIMDMSASGIFRSESVNLLELL